MTINKYTSTQKLLTSGSKSSGTKVTISSTTYPDLSSLLAVYYSDYDEHTWVLSYIMRYLW